MRLHHWTHPHKEIEFNLDSGKGKLIRLDKPRNEKCDCPGFSSSEKRLFGLREYFAIFKNEQGIVFYAGKRYWQLNDQNVTVKHSHPFPFLSRFVVQVSGSKEYTITYSHLARLLFMFIDPTYDKIDQDADFFLEFVAENGNSEEWLQHAENKWHEAKGT